jgi:dTDP-D-glucose 4,6-dehydratase
VSKIKRDLGWEAKVEIEDGLRKMIEWYIKNPRPLE